MTPRYILSRAAFLLVLLISALFILKFVKRKQRETAIFIELKSLASESSFFQQFYVEDARKTLIRALALIGEAKQQHGISPDHAIDRGLGLESNIFATKIDAPDPTPRQNIIRNCLRTNYENFLKLGYSPDFQTLKTMQEGSLPPIPIGPEAGNRPVITTLINPALSPGLEKVIANLVIIPPTDQAHVLTDIEITAAKQLAKELVDAKLIEDPARQRIFDALTPPPPTPPGK